MFILLTKFNSKPITIAPTPNHMFLLTTVEGVKHLLYAIFGDKQQFHKKSTSQLYVPVSPRHHHHCRILRYANNRNVIKSGRKTSLEVELVKRAARLTAKSCVSVCNIKKMCTSIIHEHLMHYVHYKYTLRYKYSNGIVHTMIGIIVYYYK